MGWQDRQYSDPSFEESLATRCGVRRPPNGTLAFMVAHGAAFLLMLMLSRSADGDAALRFFRLDGAEPSPAAILLHPLATTSLFTALFVVLAGWSLGGRLEPRLGRPRLIALYLGGNLAAGAAYFAIARARPEFAAAPLDYPVGALAVWCWAVCRRLGHEPVQVLGRETSVAKVYAICAAVVAGLVLLSARQGALAWLAGAASGVGTAVLAEYWLAASGRRRRRPRRVVRPSIPRDAIHPDSSDEAGIDAILAKISRAGVDALSDAEREQLEAARQARLRRTESLRPFGDPPQ